MILISCRKDFSDSRAFSERNAMRNLPFLRSHGGYRTAGSYYEHWSRVLREAPLPRFETLK